MSITELNLVEIDLDTLDLTVVGHFNNFGTVLDAVIMRSDWLIFSDSQIYRINRFNLTERYRYDWGCNDVFCSAVDVVASYDANQTFWIFTDARTVVEFTIETFPEDTPGGQAGQSMPLPPNRVSPAAPSGFAAIASAVFSPSLNSLFIISSSGILIRFDLTTFTWIASSQIEICRGSAPRINTMQIDELKRLIYVACPSRPTTSSLGASLTSVSKVNYTNSNSPTLAGNVVIRPPGYPNGVVITDVKTMFFDPKGDLLYFSLQPDPSFYNLAQGCLVEIPAATSFTNTSLVNFLFLEEKVRELFYHVAFDSRSTSSNERYAFWTVSPLPFSFDTVGRLSMIRIN